MIDNDGYFGSPRMRALQRAQDGRVDSLRDRPGAVLHARCLSSDDPDALGWATLREAMARDGMVALRGADDATVARGQAELAAFDPVLHRWDIFRADADTIRDVCTPLAAAPLPPGVQQVPRDAITPALVDDVQRFLDGHGVSPFSRDALLGRLFPAELVVLRHDAGAIAATGFAAMTHNRHSPFHDTAWVGLIAVDPALRGSGLGTRIDAIANLAAVTRLGAAAAIEFVARDNAPSRAMLRRCGLRQMPGRAVVLFSRSRDRPTR